MSVHECLVGAAGTAASPERTPIKNLPRMSRMRTDQEGMAGCHTHAATKLSSHRSLRSLTICGHLRNPWEALLRQKLLCVP